MKNRVLKIFALVSVVSGGLILTSDGAFAQSNERKCTESSAPLSGGSLQVLKSISINSPLSPQARLTACLTFQQNDVELQLRQLEEISKKASEDMPRNDAPMGYSGFSGMARMYADNTTDVVNAGFSLALFKKHIKNPESCNSKRAKVKSYVTRIWVSDVLSEQLNRRAKELEETLSLAQSRSLSESELEAIAETQAHFYKGRVSDQLVNRGGSLVTEGAFGRVSPYQFEIEDSLELLELKPVRTCEVQLSAKPEDRSDSNRFTRYPSLSELKNK